MASLWYLLADSGVMSEGDTIPPIEISAGYMVL